MNRYNWAVLGCGKIAKKFSEDLKLLPNAKLYAAASRSQDRADAFALENGFERAYGSYEEMVKDPNVDIVYVASPHSEHYDHTILCLENGKAVLCEKAFAMNRYQAAAMVECAKRNNKFLMEAFWTMFQESYQRAMEIIRSGEMGALKMVRSDFAFNGPYDPENRLYNLALGGGSLLDIGIYPVFAALTALGKPDQIKTVAEFSPTGSEETISMIFRYDKGVQAVLSSSFESYSPVQTEYWFEKGYMVLNTRWFAPTSITLKKMDEDLKSWPCLLTEGMGYQFEAAHVMECLDKGLIESPRMTWQLTLDLMETLDRVRDDAGIFFDSDPEGGLF